MRSVGAALLLGCIGAAMLPPGARALGPYPGLGRCHVFPDPPASLSARAPSLPTQSAWNQDISRAPIARNSAAIIGYINRHGGSFLHPDFGSPRAYGFPYAVVGDHQHRQRIGYTAYGRESDHEPFPIPARAPVEGGARSGGDRHVLVINRSRCILYELFRGFFFPHGRGLGSHWNADSGASWDLRSNGRTIARALKRYGMIVADNGSNWFFSGTSDRRWDDASLNQLEQIPGRAFQVVRSAAHVHVC